MFAAVHRKKLGRGFQGGYQLHVSVAWSYYGV